MGSHHVSNRVVAREGRIVQFGHSEVLAQNAGVVIVVFEVRAFLKSTQENSFGISIKGSGLRKHLRDFFGSTGNILFKNGYCELIHDHAGINRVVVPASTGLVVVFKTVASEEELTYIAASILV